MSGIQPTGDIHIGNYLGAIKEWINLAEKYPSFYVIVDYHAITIPYKVEEFQNTILKSAMVNMACGLKPDKCLLFVQSYVPEHTELCWIFTTLTMVGRLFNMTQFKDKSKQHSQAVNAGLLNYPILQAADILIYKASLVPVGKDQYQHLELTREIARRFNSRFGKTFPEPTPCGKGLKIIGLDGKYKMSKSRGNHIAILDSPDVIKRKLKTAFTDPQRLRLSDPGRPEVCNIYSLHSFFTDKETINQIYEDCTKAKIGCVQCKMILAENIIKDLAPIQEEYHRLEKMPDYVQDFLFESAKKARVIAKQTIEEVKSKMGLSPKKYKVPPPLF